MGHAPPTPGGTPQGVSNGDRPAGTGATPTASSIDDLISGAAKEANQAVATPAPAKEATEEKASKKDKSKQAKLVYSDNETSPEEKMAQLSRYAFVPDRRGETALEELPSSTVVGAIRESDTVVDPTD